MLIILLYIEDRCGVGAPRLFNCKAQYNKLSIPIINYKIAKAALHYTAIINIFSATFDQSL